MKLRNKKTGEVFDALIREKGGGGLYSLIVCDIKAYEQSKSTLDATHFILDEYGSLAELNEDWEDYTPAEPLIKDDKIRQIIKAWAKVNEVESVFITAIKDPENGYLYWELAGIEWEQTITICFGGELPDTLEDLGTYTIEELCGSSSDEEGE